MNSDNPQFSGSRTSPNSENQPAVAFEGFPSSSRHRGDVVHALEIDGASVARGEITWVQGQPWLVEN